MDRRMAASLDHWLTTPPDWYAGEEPEIQCGFCDADLKYTPDRVEHREATQPCNGKVLTDGWGSYAQPCADYDWGMVDENTLDHEPHTAVVWAWDVYVRVCPTCGEENLEDIV